MNSIGLLRRILDRVMRDPIGLIISVFLTYSVLWTMVEASISFIEGAQVFFTGWSKFLIFLIVSVLVGTIRHLRPLDISLKIRNSIVRVTFGDLFKFDGYKAIPVSRFMFETDVIGSSLQGVLIKRFIDSDPNSGLKLYHGQMKDELANITFDQVRRPRSRATEKYYALGTTAKVTINGEKYLLFALTKTEKQGYIESDNCSVTDLWESMQLLWRNARIQARGSSINIPLVGTGVAGIDLPPQRVLELNLLSLFNSIIEEGQITTNEIRIVLHNRFFEEIDLRQLKSSWSTAN